MFNFSNLLNNLSSLQRSLVVSIAAIVLFVASVGISYTLFSRAGQPINGQLVTSLPGPATSITEEPDEPKTEECPLNWSMRTKKAKDNWVILRPLAVVIENHTEARPQSGLSSADIIYEAVAEGGITRFMGVFYCNLSDVQVGPVRSARTFFLDWASEYDPLYAHVGGANCTGGPGAPGCQNGAPADALGQIIKYGIKSLNQFGVGFPTYWRDYQRLGRPVATEHTMYSTTKKLWEIGAKRGWTATDSAGIRWDKGFTPWKFMNEGDIKKAQADGS